MPQETLQIEDATKNKIAYPCNQTRKTPRAAILVCQSIEENIEDYNDFCTYLAEENIAAYIYSHRNTIKTANNSLPGYSEKENNSTPIIQEVMKLRSLISENHGNIPVLLFGYSLGTVIALSTLIKYPKKFSGIALWNLDLCFEKYNCLLMDSFLKIEKFFKGSDTPSRFMRYMTENIWIRNNKNWKHLLGNLTSNIDSKGHIINNNYSLNTPISVWLELMSMATDINAQGSFNTLSRSIPFCLVSGGNPLIKIEDHSQIYKLAERLHNEEFYAISLMTFPPILPNDPCNTIPPQAIKKLRNWIVKSYLPKVTPLISQYQK
ncbi:alpha/beta hydrolase [Candidatus Liberibacter solanacearum]|uniref:Lysophospholipase n=1 Tax=Candidatus Liberibacter solanacearum TaxID=556287 RepID=A0A1V2N913_9HYPH|nr:alpha/beta hydrolase [Candidatus Liberibacter solanacearum]ONI58560.1 lysophospholipase [Candidatus Liberibacter solanacearum]ONI60174.1 lysophospholipase [Candidatus Liberibacter solanacearum]